MVTKNLLPVGTYVRVTERRFGPTRVYVAKVVGYDLGHSKYELGMRFGGWGEWLFLDGGSWAFPDEVEEISKDEAVALP